ncbi:MAG: hypothetical protein ACI392_01630 [Paludibacteraceae bacterium]
MKHQLKYMGSRIVQRGTAWIGFLLHPDKAFRLAAMADDAEKVASHSVAIGVVCCGIAELIGFAIDHDTMWFFPVLSALLRMAALWSAWWLSVRGIVPLVRYYPHVELTQRDGHLLVSYGMITVFATDCILSFMPISFLYVLAFGNIFVLHSGVTAYVDADDAKVGQLTIALSAWLCVLPCVVEYVLKMLLPNAPL